MAAGGRNSPRRRAVFFGSLHPSFSSAVTAAGHNKTYSKTYNSTQTNSRRTRPMSHPFTLLATVGSTLFPSLTSHVLLPTFLSLLQSLGVQRLVVQYGRGELKLQDNVKQTLSINPQGYGRGVWSDNDGGGDGDRKQNGMVVEVMRFTNDFEGLVGNSDAVISHAGMIYL